jgi:hypothetical protein
MITKHHHTHDGVLSNTNTPAHHKLRVVLQNVADKNCLFITNIDGDLVVSLS